MDGENPLFCKYLDNLKRDQAIHCRTSSFCPDWIELPFISLFWRPIIQFQNTVPASRCWWSSACPITAKSVQDAKLRKLYALFKYFKHVNNGLIKFQVTNLNNDLSGHPGQQSRDTKPAVCYLCTAGVQTRAFRARPLSCSLFAALFVCDPRQTVLGTSFEHSCQTYIAMSLSQSTLRSVLVLWSEISSSVLVIMFLHDDIVASNRLRKISYNVMKIIQKIFRSRPNSKD